MKKIFLSLLVIALSYVGIAQPVATKTYTNQSGIQNLNTNSGDVIYFEGNNSIQSGTLNSGATFVVDKNATLSISGGVNVNGGTVYVEAGASFTSSQNLSNNQVVWYNSGLITVSGNLELGSYTGTTCSALVISGVWQSYNTLQGGGLIKVSSGNTSWHVFPLAASGSTFTVDFTNNGLVDADGATPNQFHPKDASATSVATQENVTISTADLPTNACTDLPVLFVNVSALLNDGTLTFKWTTTSETNNKNFIIEGSVDGATWTTVGTVDSYWTNGTGSTSHDYTFNYYDLVVTEAGFGIVAVILLIGMAGGFVRTARKGIVLPMVALIVFAASCHKTTVQTQNSVRYKYFRLKSVDLDGTAHYYQTVFKVA